MAASRRARNIRAVELPEQIWKPLQNIQIVDKRKSLTEVVHRILEKYIQDRPMCDDGPQFNEEVAR